MSMLLRRSKIKQRHRGSNSCKWRNSQARGVTISRLIPMTRAVGSKAHIVIFVLELSKTKLFSANKQLKRRKSSTRLRSLASTWVKAVAKKSLRR